MLLTLWTKKRHLEGWIGPFNVPLSFPWALTPLSLNELIYFIIIFVSGLMIPVMLSPHTGSSASGCHAGGERTERNAELE